MNVLSPSTLTPSAPADWPMGAAERDMGMVIGTVEDVNYSGISVCLKRTALNQLRDHPDHVVAMCGSVGGQVKIRARGFWLIGSIRETMAGATETMRVLVDLLGEAHAAGEDGLVDFRRGVTQFPSPGDPVLPMDSDDLAGIFSGQSHAAIDVGTVYPTTTVRASLDVDPFLARHFALLGSTGSGKSTAAALILHRIMDHAPHGHIVVVDPHGEYAGAFGERGMVFNVDNLALPYWLMNYEEHCEVFVTSEGAEREQTRAILAKCLGAARAKSLLAETYKDLTVDTPIPYLMAELLGALNAEMGRLENSSEVGRHLRLKVRIEEILRDKRYGFMFNRSLVADTMKDFLQRLLRLENDGRPISILDLSGVPSDIISVVVALVSRIVMDHAIWARSEAPRPILLVCEEAHRYVPAERISSGSAARRSLERIAKEGRKYGVSLGLISQRPSDLAEGALSQCGTIIAMRLNNEPDQTCVRNAMPEGGRGFLEAIPALSKGEAIISGEGVALPVRIRLDMPDIGQRPSSADPSFSRLWSAPAADAGAVERTIGRWRGATEPVPGAAPADTLFKRPSLLLERS